MPQVYDRFDVVETSQVIDLIDEHFLNPKDVKVEIKGQLVKINSLRLKTFAMSDLKCSRCGLEAKFFAIERDMATKKSNGPYHLNLYGILPDNTEMLFTHDHTLARSLGGKDHISNTTTMCRQCNFEKSLTEK
jgi:hypothetical protein